MTTVYVVTAGSGDTYRPRRVASTHVLFVDKSDLRQEELELLDPGPQVPQLPGEAVEALP